MADGLLQRFSTHGVTSSTLMPPAAAVASTGATLSQRIHHLELPPALLASGKYPVYGPGSGPEIYDDAPTASGYGWPGADGTGPGGFLPSFLPWGQPSHPAPPPPPPLPPPYPLHRGPHGKFGKGLRFRGASTAVLTLLAFLFFLSILQNYIRDYSATSQPTVIVLSAGATKESGPAPYHGAPFRRQHNADPMVANDGGASEDDDRGSDEPAAGYRTRDKNTGERHQRVKIIDRQDIAGASTRQPSPAPFGDIFKINGL
ncbi:uncharacterized protein LOC131207531 [Anopheles bellator]|uniref:uncharacterized protein LOC131207531 n=1 Tax=Anopheles bellator TaxID=139047 RepID=UPI002647978B|nr:uncharacterized protein LOC131207531 [Anopheles bellator]